MLNYFNVQLFDNAPVAVALFPVTLVIVYRVSCCSILIMYCLMLDSYNVALVNVTLF